MKKFIELIKKNKAVVIVLVFVCLFSFNIAKADNDNFGSILDKIIQIMKMEQSNSSDMEAEIGASSGNMLAESYIPYIMYNGGYNSAKPIETSDDMACEDLVSSGDISATGDAAFTGDLTVTGGKITHGTIIEDFIEGTCADATTTLFSIVNPESADITILRSYFSFINGTSTVDVTVGTSTTAVGITSAPTDLIIDNVEMSTSTLGTATTTMQTYNTNGTVSATSGFTDPGTNSEDWVEWKAGEYITGYATGTANSVAVFPQGITGDNNIFSCKYRIHYRKFE